MLPYLHVRVYICLDKLALLVVGEAFSVIVGIFTTIFEFFVESITRNNNSWEYSLPHLLVTCILRYTIYHSYL